MARPKSTAGAAGSRACSVSAWRRVEAGTPAASVASARRRRTTASVSATTSPRAHNVMPTSWPATRGRMTGEVVVVLPEASVRSAKNCRCSQVDAPATTPASPSSSAGRVVGPGLLGDPTQREQQLALRCARNPRGQVSDEGARRWSALEVPYGACRRGSGTSGHHADGEQRRPPAGDHHVRRRCHPRTDLERPLRPFDVAVARHGLTNGVQDGDGEPQQEDPEGGTDGDGDGCVGDRYAPQLVPAGARVAQLAHAVTPFNRAQLQV